MKTVSALLGMVCFTLLIGTPGTSMAAPVAHMQREQRLAVTLNSPVASPSHRADFAITSTGWALHGAGASSLPTTTSAISQDSATPEASPAAEEPMVAGEIELTWTGDWQYEASGSVPDVAVTLALADQGSGQDGALATYTEVSIDTIDDPAVMLEMLVTGFFATENDDAPRLAGQGALENGVLWRVYTFHNGTATDTLLITVREPTNGTFAVSLLIGPPAGFGDSIAAAQRDIMLDGEPVFLEGFHADEVMDLLFPS